MRRESLTKNRGVHLKNPAQGCVEVSAGEGARKCDIEKGRGHSI